MSLSSCASRAQRGHIAAPGIRESKCIQKVRGRTDRGSIRARRSAASCRPADYSRGRPVRKGHEGMLVERGSTREDNDEHGTASETRERSGVPETGYGSADRLAERVRAEPGHASGVTRGRYWTEAIRRDAARADTTGDEIDHGRVLLIEVCACRAHDANVRRRSGGSCVSFVSWSSPGDSPHT